MAIGVAALGVPVVAMAGGASAKRATPVLTLSEEQEGGTFRALQPGNPYFATEETGWSSAAIFFERSNGDFEFECSPSTFFGKLESNGRSKDSIILEGVTGALTGEDACHTPAGPDRGEVTVTVSGFPWHLTLGPWGGEPNDSKTKSGKLKGRLVVSVQSSVVGSCVYRGTWGTIGSDTRAGGLPSETTPQDWDPDNPKLTPESRNGASCPGHAKFLTGVWESVGPGGTPIMLRWK